jgi:hypothetical protein
LAYRFCEIFMDVKRVAFQTGLRLLKTYCFRKVIIIVKIIRTLIFIDLDIERKYTHFSFSKLIWVKKLRIIVLFEILYLVVDYKFELEFGKKGIYVGCVIGIILLKSLLLQLFKCYLSDIISNIICSCFTHTLKLSLTGFICS